MDPSRKSRYIKKISFLQERIQNLEQFSKKSLSALELDGIYYRIQTAIDCMMDLIAMILSDRGIQVLDDYSNIEKMFESGLFDTQIIRKLKDCNGLRNAIAHHYNGLIQDRVLNSITELKEIAEDFITLIDKMIDDD
jgi:uncharacterized protein YutE (UPF0331/DUF86 family)